MEDAELNKAKDRYLCCELMMTLVLDDSDDFECSHADFGTVFWLDFEELIYSII